MSPRVTIIGSSGGIERGSLTMIFEKLQSRFSPVKAGLFSLVRGY